ncbi:zinc metalloproteinase-disintegrin-like jararhagin isoform X2 [Oscarella lobularis]|uniref:zinc metalloproteinase-disintegrin-like jararhagin isoform X2 n=1 Tax=Oscarella lobularis TaxID=121494 RepID=UPI0033133261
MSSPRSSHFVSFAILLLASILFETSRGEKEIVLPRDKFGQPLGRRFTAKKGGGHVDETTVRLQVFGKELVLGLELNTNLLSENYVSLSFTQEGKIITKKGIDNCYYHGRVSGFAHSSAVISSCNGLEGVFFYGSDLDTYFYINPLKDELDGSFLHSIERASDLEAFPITNTCGNESNRTHRFSNPIRSPFAEHEIAKRSQMRIPRDVTGETKYVELLLVNDNSRFNTSGSVAAVEFQTVRIANIADDNYRRQLNTRVVLVGVITWNNGDQIEVSSVAGTTLARFAEYRRTVLSQTVPNDVAYLLTQIDFDGSTIGVAYLGGACTVFGAVGAVQFLASAETLASTLTHELGHNLGMNHDDGRPCDICSDSTNGCIMAASFNASRPPTEFAKCSELDYCDYLENGHGSCLFNVPTNAFSPPECGNHFVEEGEECDCGTPAECGALSKCCNSSTCLLQPGSQCANGLCCNTSECSFLHAGVPCRENVTVCDLTEYCSGDNGECPANLHLQDGTACFDLVESKCYDGECNSRLKQCQSIWGFDAIVADDSCYALNVRGDQLGFCARTNGTFFACEAKDQQCGLLFCSGGSTNPMGREITSIAFFTAGAGCRAAYTFDGTEDTPVEGMVSNGITCGQEEICLNQQCMKLSKIVTPCPVGENRQICSGNGVCNSNDECSCSEGYFPHNCTVAPTTALTTAPTTEAVTTALPTTTSVPTTTEPTMTALPATTPSVSAAALTTVTTAALSTTTGKLTPSTTKAELSTKPAITASPKTSLLPTTAKPVTTVPTKTANTKSPTTAEPTTEPIATSEQMTAVSTTVEPTNETKGGGMNWLTFVLAIGLPAIALLLIFAITVICLRRRRQTVNIAKGKGDDPKYYSPKQEADMYETIHYSTTQMRLGALSSKTAKNPAYSSVVPVDPVHKTAENPAYSSVVPVDPVHKTAENPAYSSVVSVDPVHKTAENPAYSSVVLVDPVYEAAENSSVFAVDPIYATVLENETATRPNVDCDEKKTCAYASSKL